MYIIAEYFKYITQIMIKVIINTVDAEAFNIFH